MNSFPPPPGGSSSGPQRPPPPGGSGMPPPPGGPPRPGGMPTMPMPPGPHQQPQRPGGGMAAMPPPPGSGMTGMMPPPPGGGRPMMPQPQPQQPMQQQQRGGMPPPPAIGGGGPMRGGGPPPPGVHTLNQAMGGMTIVGPSPPPGGGLMGVGGGSKPQFNSGGQFQQQQPPPPGGGGYTSSGSNPNGPPSMQLHPQLMQQQQQQPMMRPPVVGGGVGFNPANMMQQQQQQLPPPNNNKPPLPGSGQTTAMFHPQPQPQQQQGGGGGMMGMGMGGTPRQNMAGGGMMAPPPGPGGNVGGSSSNVVGGVATGNTAADIYQENFDPTIKVPTRIVRPTTKYIPVSMTLAHTTKVSLGAIIRPLAPPGPDEEDVLVVQPGPAGIVRCKRCRTYINAFVTFLENGRRWRCNICSQLNEVPAPYFCHLDEDGRRRDRESRPELSQGVVEFIAPSEYMVRPPQPPSYFFVIDVSLTSARSGMLASVAHAISSSLDTLPGHPRTQVGFLTYDESVHYYCLKSGMTSPQMLVVADLVELFVPAPDDLLVNLQDCREVIDIFLENLPTMFTNTTSQASCLGPALKAAFTVTKHIGGKMCVFQSVLPTLGDGALVPREQMQLMGTPKEVELLRPGQNWYKETAIEFSRAQIGVDMFLFPRAYIDVAALAELPKITAGTLHTYPGFNYDIDGPRFESELCRCLTQPTAFEAVMRIRCTRGMKISNFYGNFFVRGTDLLALPNCSSDSVFAFDLVHDEQNVTSNVVTIQSALLYTSSDGERRIRVVTQAIPVSSMASEVINSVDADALTCLLAKQALDVSLKTNLDNARNKILMSCVDLIRASKEGDKPRMISGYAAPPPMHGQHHQQHGPESESKETPENLKLLPLYTLAMMKNVAFRGGTDIHPDERVHAMNLLSGMGVIESKIFVHPRMFSLNDMTSSAGLPSNITDDTKVAGQDRIELPRSLNLTIDRLASNGIFLLDNGIEMFLWVGRSASPAILNSLFGTNSLEGIDMSQVKLQRGGNDYASRLNTIFLALREDDTPQTLYAKVIIVREGDHGLESRFFWHLIEDSASFSGGTFSYDEFVQFVNSGGQGGPPGRGPPGPPNMPHQGGPPGPPQQMHQGPPPPQQNRPPGPPMNQPRMNQGPPPPMNHGPPPPPHQMQGPPPGGMPPPKGMPGRPMPPPQMSNQQQQPPPAYNGQQQYTSGPPSGQYSGPPSGQYSGPPSGPPPPMQQMNSAPPPPGPPYGRPPPPGPPPPPQYHR